MKTIVMNDIFKKTLFFLMGFCLLTVGLKIAVTSNFSFGADFYTFWQAGRALFLHGVSPYSLQVTEISQLGIYGRLAQAGEDQLRFAYPPFSLLILLPTVGMTYAWAQAYWMAFNLALILGAVLVVNKKPSIWLLVGMFFFYPVARGIIMGQFALMIGAIQIICYGLLKDQPAPNSLKQWLAGALLAWTMMKPHLAGLVIIFFLLFSIRQRYWKVFAGFAAGALLLAILSWILVPTWVSDWIHLIIAYAGYVNVQPILGSWLAVLGLSISSQWVSLILLFLTLMISISLICAWWKRNLQDFILLGWLVLISQLVNPNANSLLSDQIVFFLPLLLWLKDRSIKDWLRGTIYGIFVILPWILFAAYFRGKEPYAVASWLAMMFSVWLVYEIAARKIKINSTGTAKIEGPS
jgi:hypothetical protein